MSNAFAASTAYSQHPQRTLSRRQHKTEARKHRLIAVLSPLLYAIFINGLAEELNRRELGVDCFGHRVGILLYADDIVLVAETAEQLQEMLDCSSAYATQWHFRFNTKPGKSDVVVCPKQPVERVFTLGDGPLHVSD